jgi:hypothetical protein
MNMHMLYCVTCCNNVDNITAHLVYGCSYQSLHQQIASIVAIR